MNWHDGTFVFPDDGGAAMRRLIAMTAHDGHWISDGDIPAYIVKVEDRSALVYLRMAVAMTVDIDKCKPDADELGADDAFEPFLLIAAEDRTECERLLRDNCPSSVQWFSVMVVGTSTDIELAKFRELYDAYVCRSSEMDEFHRDTRLSKSPISTPRSLLSAATPDQKFGQRR